MTRFEIEMLAIALYESFAREVNRANMGAAPWIHMANDVRETWRSHAREILTESTSA